MRNTIILVFVSGGFNVHAQRLLHFTATSGFDHGTRDVSFAMFQSIGLDLGITVDDAPTASAFNDPGSLFLYDAIVFSNTSGNAILNDEQRTNFEQWIAGGGHVMGIHAASDTYRHSTANGNNTGTWDFYAELIGASVQEDPNHVSGTPPYEMMHIGAHPSTSNLPDPWLKNEEYYYWEGGYFNPANNVVLEVEETIGPNGLVNSYDAQRPMSWYQELPSGSHIFYTALGHAASNYTGDEGFRQHVKDALAWMLEASTSLAAQSGTSPFTLSNDGRAVSINTSTPQGFIRVVDPTGRIVHEAFSTGPLRIGIEGWATGLYVFVVGDQARPVFISN
ncbi:MAG TPA: ThuA domain-containing protein [Flavobacteriales bacterium]|nr:ThuA domain-containing protein [Flavobacteriales bacterium]